MTTGKQGNAQDVHGPDFVYGWELCGRAAIQKGPHKAVFIPKPKGPEVWQLYNVVEDPGEIHDLSSEKPDLLKDLLVHWEDYVKRCGVVPLQPELGEYLEATEEQMQENAWIEYEFWKQGALEDREKFFIKPWRQGAKASA